MNARLRKIGVMTTILTSFIEAMSGSSWGAVMFWLTLIAAAILSDPHEPRAAVDRRLM
jgi:hypothetical protein